jgi:hypothetical protein
MSQSRADPGFVHQGGSQELEIRESEIEDVFALYPHLLQSVLGVSDDMFLMARQKPLPAGRLDLLYACLSEIFLIELKVESFKRKFIDQVLSYRGDLQVPQEQGKFLRGNIVPYLLCPGVDGRGAFEIAAASGVRFIVYDPARVLVEFFNHAPLDTKYMSVVPSDKGVWRIGLINPSLDLAASASSVNEIARLRGLSTKTVGNQLRLGEELGLVLSTGGQALLTEFGREFLAKQGDAIPTEVISREQADSLRKFILFAPFFSGTTFGILTMVACVFELSKNTYPVPLSILSDHFIDAAGLHFRWDKDKGREKGVRMYSNYAIELGLLGKIGNGYFVTPSGLKFVLLLGMHKSLRFIETIDGIQ